MSQRSRRAGRGRLVEQLEVRRLMAASSGFVPPAMPQTATNFTQVVHVLVLNYDPTVPSQGNRRLHEVEGWADPHALAAGYEADMEYASGGAVDYQITEFRDLNELAPDTAGFRMNGDQYVQALPTHDFHTEGADYYRIAAEQNVAPLINGGQVDEIWMFGPPFHAGTYESWMYGPQSFWINGGTYPDIAIDRAVPAFGFNYERGVAEMIHDTGHRTEDSMARAFGGSWSASNTNTAWEKFAAVTALTTNHTGAVGNTHYPVNGTGDYDYGNATAVASTANDWLNYPNLTGATTLVSRSAWSAGPSPDYQRDYLQWFFGHLPRNTGTTADGRQNNWWKYLYDFNSYEPNTGLPRHESAVLGAATLRQRGGASYDFTVRYYDQTGVNPTTLDGNDLQVTGPGGFSQLAQLVSAGTSVTTSAGTARTATYRVTAPGGTWDDADAGSYSISMRTNQVRDTLGNAVAAGQLGSFNVDLPDPSRVDVNALVSAGQATVTGTAPDIGSFAALFDGNSDSLYRTPSVNPAIVQLAFTSPQTLRGFRLQFSPNVGMNWTVEIADTQADLDNHTGSWQRVVNATSPKGPGSASVTLAGAVTARFVKLTATQTQGDNYVHLYEFALLGPAINDSTPPTTAFAAQNVTTHEGATHFFTVTYNDASAVDNASIRNGNLRVTGPGGFDQPAVFYDLDQYQNGPTRVATYFVVAPGGAWDAPDNGTYTVTLQPNQVRDTSGNTAASAVTLGTFVVAVPPPATRPSADLTEMNAGLWSSAAQSATASTSDDTSRRLFGDGSVRFVTDGGFDTYMRYPPPGDADWNLTEATKLTFSVYAENPSPFGFQNGSPWILLTDTFGNSYQYQYFKNGGIYDLLNEARNTWRTYQVPLNSSSNTTNGWRRTVVGGAAPADLAHVRSIEFHADTWDAGFTLWYDGVGFDVPVHVTSGTFAYDAPTPALTFTTDDNVIATLAKTDLKLTNLTTGVTIPAGNMQFVYDANSRTATFTFPGYAGGRLPDGNYRATFAAGSIADPAGHALAADYHFDFFSLAGDANRDRTVGPGDFNLLASHFGQGGQTWGTGDFDGDGTVGPGDFNLLASRFGTTLESPPPQTVTLAARQSESKKPLPSSIAAGRTIPRPTRSIVARNRGIRQDK